MHKNMRTRRSNYFRSKYFIQFIIIIFALCASYVFADELLDDDGDGLNNKEEQIHGTDIKKADTDNDGLSDAEEILDYGTNSQKSDSDEDTLSDYEEVYIYQTEPTKKDSDEDNVNDYEEIKIYQTNPNIKEKKESAINAETPTGAVTAEQSTFNPQNKNRKKGTKFFWVGLSVILICFAILKFIVVKEEKKKKKEQQFQWE